MGQFLPADHARGDANTIGGYMAVHARPAAFEGKDGASYSVEIVADETGERGKQFGAFLLFVKWRAEIQSRLDIRDRLSRVRRHRSRSDCKSRSYEAE